MGPAIGALLVRRWVSREVAGDARETNALNLTVEELGRVRAEYQHARAATPSHLAPTWTQVTDTAYSSLLIDAVLMVCALAIRGVIGWQGKCVWRSYCADTPYLCLDSYIDTQYMHFDVSARIRHHVRI